MPLGAALDDHESGQTGSPEEPQCHRMTGQRAANLDTADVPEEGPGGLVCDELLGGSNSQQPCPRADADTGRACGIADARPSDSGAIGVDQAEPGGSSMPAVDGDGGQHRAGQGVDQQRPVAYVPAAGNDSEDLVNHGHDAAGRAAHHREVRDEPGQGALHRFVRVRRQRPFHQDAGEHHSQIGGDQRRRGRLSIADGVVAAGVEGDRFRSGRRCCRHEVVAGRSDAGREGLVLGAAG